MRECWESGEGSAFSIPEVYRSDLLRRSVESLGVGIRKAALPVVWKRGLIA